MKLTSVLAGFASASFSKNLIEQFGVTDGLELLSKNPHFDCRIMNLPNDTEFYNMLLWRAKDCYKNAISMAAHHHFSHASLQNKLGVEKLQLLSDINIDFDNYYPSQFRTGTWAVTKSKEAFFTSEELAKIPLKHQPTPNNPIYRSTVETFELNRYSTIDNIKSLIS